MKTLLLSIACWTSFDFSSERIKPSLRTKVAASHICLLSCRNFGLMWARLGGVQDQVRWNLHMKKKECASSRKQTAAQAEAANKELHQQRRQTASTGQQPEPETACQVFSVFVLCARLEMLRIFFAYAHCINNSCSEQPSKTWRAGASMLESCYWHQAKFRSRGSRVSARDPKVWTV